MDQVISQIGNPENQILTIEKKNWMIFEVVRNYLYSYIDFQHIYKKYRMQTLQFKDVEGFVTDRDISIPLFKLKQTCHRLFRQNLEEGSTNEERLLDLAIGSIFHEAMKMRENLYQLTVYKPYYLQLHNTTYSPDYEKKLLHEFMKIGTKAEKGLAESMIEIKRLFDETKNHIANILPKYKNNPILMRFLLRNMHLMQGTFGKRNGAKIISNMFEKGIGEAYATEGKSYLISEHYDLAAEFFKHAIKYNSKDSELKFFYFYAYGMDCYYKNKYADMVRALGKALLNIPHIKNHNEYLEKAAEICRRTATECREDKKWKLVTSAEELADKIKSILAGNDAIRLDQNKPPKDAVDISCARIFSSGQDKNA